MKPRSRLARLLYMLPPVLALVLLQTGTPGSAAEDESPPPAERAQTQEEATERASEDSQSEQAPSEQGQSEQGQADNRPATQPPSAADRAPANRASPQRFEPSEQVRADFDVSFPVDI